MKILRILMIALAALTVSVGMAQPGTANAQKADAAMEAIRKLDLLNQILPIVLTKEQVNQLLPVVEKARAKVRLTMQREAEELGKMQSRLDAAVKEATDNQKLPDKALLAEANKLINTLTLVRQVITEENTDLVLEQLKKTCNAGQLKTAANSLDPRYYGSTAKPAEVKEETKLRLFVREILLDALTYDLLLKMAK